MEVSNISILSDKASSKPSSKASSKASRSPSRKQVGQINSEDITMSDLELLANNKKMKKKETLSVADIVSKDSVKDSEVLKETKTKRSISKKSSTSSSTSSSSDDSDAYKKAKSRKVNKENKNDNIRREKSELLYKINMLNSKGVRSSLKLDMNSSLDEIKNEYERIRTNMENERMVKFCKQMLLMGVQGVEMLNTKFDPLGVDLDGWSEAMGYSMENQEYDQVLSELYEKYKGSGQMSPEVKLLLMIAGSAAMFTITKKITKMDSSDSMLGNILGSFMGQSSKQQQPPQQYQQPPQQQYQQPPQQYHQPPQQYHQPLPFGVNVTVPTPFSLQNQNFNNVDNYSESSDAKPSRIKGPAGSFDSPDSMNLQNIIKTMNEKKRQKNDVNDLVFDASEITEPVQVKNVSLKPKGRGRPKKVKN